MNDFNDLIPYRDPQTWEDLSQKEREELGSRFHEEGLKLVEKDLDRGLQTLELATALCPKNGKKLFEKGMIYSQFCKDRKGLRAACKAFRASAKHHYSPFASHFGWANALVELGLITRESKHFDNAHKKYLLAKKGIPEDTHDEVTAKFYWNFGKCWFLIGRASLEVCDFSQAITCFNQAREDGLDSAEFWNDFGNILSELNFLIQDQGRCFSASLDMYHKAVKKDPAFFRGWFNLACSYQFLFSHTLDSATFECAEDCFRRVFELDQKSPYTIIKWGQLYVSKAKIHGVEKYLFEAVDKFKQAETMEPASSLVQRCLGEALVLCGIETEQLTLLKLGKEKILKSLELDDKDLTTYFILGMCHHEFGRYFEEKEHYMAAVDAFQKGLSLREQEPTLWYGMALSYFALGEIEQDKELFKQAASCCHKACDLGATMSSQFLNDWGVIILRLAELSMDEATLLSAIQLFEEALNGQVDSKREGEWLVNYASALYFLGELKEEGSYYENAIKALQYALKSNPQNPYIHYQLAMCYTQLADLSEDADGFFSAIHHFEIAFSINPEDEMAAHDCAVSFMHLFDYLEDPKYLKFAEDKLQHALCLGNYEAYYTLACVSSLAKNFPLSLFFLERANEVGTLPSVDDLLADEWLENVRNTDAFSKWLRTLASDRG
jgi:tetratricopeptide (TPR) repeat protein